MAIERYNPYKRSFSRDWRQHGFFTALARRLFASQVGTQKHHYKDVLQMERPALTSLAHASVAAGNAKVLAWVFEATLAQSRSLATSWRLIWQALEDQPESAAVDLMLRCIRSVDDPAQIASLDDLDVRCAVMLGRHHMRQANTFRRNRNAQRHFDRNRELALAFLGRARQRLSDDPAATPDGQAQVDGLSYVAFVGAAYETALYMQFRTPLKTSTGMAGAAGGGG